MGVEENGERKEFDGPGFGKDGVGVDHSWTEEGDERLEFRKGGVSGYGGVLSCSRKEKDCELR